MNEDARALLEGGGRPALVYAVGAPPRGWTRLRIEPGGAYDLRSTVTSTRTEVRFEGSLDPGWLDGLLDVLREGRVWEVEHGRIAAPGEPPSRLELVDGDRSAAVELWVGEVARSPVFSRATERLVSLIGELSGGEIQEPGR